MSLYSLIYFMNHNLCVFQSIFTTNMFFFTHTCTISVQSTANTLLDLLIKIQHWNQSVLQSYGWGPKTCLENIFCYADCIGGWWCILLIQICEHINSCCMISNIFVLYIFLVDQHDEAGAFPHSALFFISSTESVIVFLKIFERPLD